MAEFVKPNTRNRIYLVVVLGVLFLVNGFPILLGLVVEPSIELLGAFLGATGMLTLIYYFAGSYIKKWEMKKGIVEG